MAGITREAGGAVRPVGADGVDVGGGDQLEHLGPRRPHEAALAAGRLVAGRPLRIAR